MFLAKPLEFISIYSVSQILHRHRIKMKLDRNGKTNKQTPFFLIFRILWAILYDQVFFKLDSTKY